MFRRTVLSQQRVNYDLELYGCPIQIPYTQRFRPTLQLYVYRKVLFTLPYIRIQNNCGIIIITGTVVMLSLKK